MIVEGETTSLLGEAAADAGGPVGSMVDEHGFTWDLGGHETTRHQPGAVNARPSQPRASARR